MFNFIGEIALKLRATATLGKLKDPTRYCSCAANCTFNFIKIYSPSRAYNLKQNEWHFLAMIKKNKRKSVPFALLVAE